MARIKRSYDWQKRAIALLAVAVVILSSFLAAFAIREAEREKLVKQADLEAEQNEIAEQIQGRIEKLISEAELKTSAYIKNLNTDPEKRILQDQSTAFPADAAWIDTVFSIDRSGKIDFILEKPLFDMNATAQASRSSAFSVLREPLLSAAEEAEFQQKNYTSARKNYLELFNRTRDRSIRANLLLSIGRCHLKSGQPLNAVPVFQDILKKYADESTPDGTPVGLLALYQIGTAYAGAEMARPAMEASLTLYKDLLGSRWLLPRARFQTYLKQAKERLLSLEKRVAADPGGAEQVDTWQSLLGIEAERFNRMKLFESILKHKDPILEKAREGELTPGEYARLSFSEGNRTRLVSLLAISDSRFLGIIFKSEYLTQILLPEAVTAYSSSYPWMVSITDIAGHALVGNAPPFPNATASELNYSQTFNSEYLPWNIHVFMPSPNPAEKVFKTRRLLYILITLVVTAALVGGGSMAIRSTAKELRLARLKSEFVSTVSHEFRTPLTSIRYLAELLERDRVKDASQKRRYYQTITRESERLSRLIENTLDFSKIEAGMKEYEFTETDVSGLVEETAAEFRNQAAPKNFVIECDIVGEIPQASLDKDAVRRALLNLLDNAFKYSGESRHIRVQTWADPKFIRIAVEDHGIGIEKAEQKKVFEKFYRSDLPHENQIRGSGIGLTLVKHIAQAHGGDVILDSQGGKGTTVTLAFPLERAG